MSMTEECKGVREVVWCVVCVEKKVAGGRRGTWEFNLQVHLATACGTGKVEGANGQPGQGKVWRCTALCTRTCTDLTSSSPGFDPMQAATAMTAGGSVTSQRRHGENKQSRSRRHREIKGRAPRTARYMDATASNGNVAQRSNVWPISDFERHIGRALARRAAAICIPFPFMARARSSRLDNVRPLSGHGSPDVIKHRSPMLIAMAKRPFVGPDACSFRRGNRLQQRP